VIAPRVRVLANVPLTWGFADGFAAGLVERDGVYAVASLRLLHRRARTTLGLSRLVVRLPGECSGCGASALERENGSETVSCSHCGRRWTGDDYRRYVGLVLSEMGHAAA
jgi:ribosomal protein L37AE/L43A